jgi:hypothetical protein
MNLRFSFAATKRAIFWSYTSASSVTFVARLKVLSLIIIIILNSQICQNLRFDNLISSWAFGFFQWPSSLFESHSTAQDNRLFMIIPILNVTYRRSILFKVRFNLPNTFMLKTLIFQNVFWHVNAVICHFSPVHLRFHFLSIHFDFSPNSITFYVFGIHVCSIHEICDFIRNLRFYFVVASKWI